MSAPAVSVVPLEVAHWPQVREVYRLGIASGHATFAASPPDWAEFAAGRPAEHRQVAVDASGQGSGRVLGWVAAVPVAACGAYVGVVEHSVYVHPDVTGRGVGRLLLQALVRSTEAAGIWTIESRVFPENTASRVLHVRAGFREVGVRHALGQMTHGPLAGSWRDVLLLERRSAVVGV